MSRPGKIIVLAVLLLFGVVASAPLWLPPPNRAENGVIDLRQRDWKDGPFRLYGTFDFQPLSQPLTDPTRPGTQPPQFSERPPRLPDHRPSPASATVSNHWIQQTVPGSWNALRTDKRDEPGVGHGLYRLRILPPPPPDYGPMIAAVSFKGLTPFNASLKVAGFPMRYGPPPRPGERFPPPGVGTEVHRLPPQLAYQDTIELTVEVANNLHRKGGLLADLFFGDEDAIRSSTTWKMTTEAAIFAVLLAFGLFNLGLYLIFSRDRVFLWFGLFCLAGLLRVGAGGQVLYASLFPGIPNFILQDLRYVGPVLSMTVFGSYLYRIFPGGMPRRANRLITVIGLSVCAVLTFTPTYTSTKLAGLIPLFALPVAAYYLWIGYRSRRDFPFRAWVMLLAGGIEVWCMVHDFLLVYTPAIGEDWNLYGLLVMVVGQGGLSLRHFRTIYVKNRRLNEQLNVINENLEATVERRTAELTQKNAELVELQRFRSRVNNMIVHDLKSPLQIILSRQQPELGGDASTYAASRRMLMMVQNILDVEKAEQAKLQVRRESIRLCDLARGSRDRLGQYAGEQNVALVVNCDFNHTVNVDRILTERSLDNLVNNAIKFSPPGGRVTLEGHAEGERLALIVSDTGPGVPEELLDSLFTDFSSQAQTGRGSHGLGLSFTRLAMEEMDGSVTYHRSEATTYFTLRFPRPAAVEQPAGRQLSAALRTTLLPQLEQLAKLPIYKISAINDALAAIREATDSEEVHDFCRHLADLAVSGDEEGYQALLGGGR